MDTTQDFRLQNLEWLDWVESGNVKQAADAVNSYTRTRVLEEGFADKIIPRVDLPDDELDPAIEHDFPRKIVHRQPEAPGAVSVPFGEFPQEFQLYGSKYEVTMRRVLTERAQKDVALLRTYPYDIRQVVADVMGKEIYAEEDRAWIAATKAALIGEDQTVPWSGDVQWKKLTAPLGRETIVDTTMTILQSLDSNLAPKLALMNVITYAGFFKMRRDEAGGDLSQRMLETGQLDENFNGIRWIGTIKKKLVINNVVYLYADPTFIGKAYNYEPVQMVLERKGFMIEYFFYESYGATIGHTGGIGAVTYAS